MKQLIRLTFACAAAALCLGGCQSAGADKPKSLVLYYSQTGTTKVVAEELQKRLGADIETIEIETPYGGSFQETIDQVMAERQQNKLPRVKALKADLTAYDVVYLGYPIWFGTYAPPIAGLLETQKFEGKRMIPFCTFGSGGLEVSVRDLKAALPKAKIEDGYGVRTARSAAVPAEIDRFLKENKLIEGTVEPLPPFSEQTEVTEEETAIFNAACGDYQFPLGTPVSCGKRTVAGGTEYQFSVKSQAPDGTESATTIYVTANGDGAKPEFTRVVR